MKNIEFHIDRIVLHGFDRIDRHQVGAAIQQKLSRLIGEQGFPSSLNQTRTVGNLNAGEFRIGKSADSSDIGTQMAQRIYRGMGQ